MNNETKFACDMNMTNKEWILEYIDSIPFTWTNNDVSVIIDINGIERFIDGYVKIEHLRHVLANDLRGLGFTDSKIFDPNEPLLSIEILDVDYNEIKVNIRYFESEIENDYIVPEYIYDRVKNLVKKVFTVHDDILDALDEHTANEYMIDLRIYYDNVYHGNINDPNDYSEYDGLNFRLTVKNPLYVTRTHILKLYDEYQCAVVDDFGNNDEFSIDVIQVVC